MALNWFFYKFILPCYHPEVIPKNKPQCCAHSQDVSCLVPIPGEKFSANYPIFPALPFSLNLTIKLYYQTILGIETKITFLYFFSAI